MKTLKLQENLYYIGVVDPLLEIFDVVVRTDYGSSFNSYLLKTDAGVVLFETVKERDFDTYLNNINAVSNIKDVKYLVMEHAEPDHSGSIKRLLEVNPNIKIVATKAALLNITEITNMKFDSIQANPSEPLTVGNYTLSFVKAPFLHWPDTMYTYINEMHALVTCDSFGAHYAHPGVLLSNLREELQKDYEDALIFYIDHIFYPYLKYMQQAIAKVEKMNIELILPGHGPVIDTKVKETIAFVKEHSMPKEIKEEAVIVYSSAYGYTKDLAKEIETTLKSIDYPFISYEIDIRNYDKVKAEIVEKLGTDKYVFIGSPTINNDCLPCFRDLLSELLATAKRKQTAMSFGTYGWTGEAVKFIDVRLNELKFNVAPNFVNKFRPTSDDLSIISHMVLDIVKK